MGAISTGNFTMLQTRYPYYLANRPQQPNADLEVTNKYTGEGRREWRLPMPRCWTRRLRRRRQRPRPMRRLAAWQRKAVLQHLAGRCRDRAEELAQQLTDRGRQADQIFAAGSQPADRHGRDRGRGSRRESSAKYCRMDISERAGGLPRHVEARAARAVRIRSRRGTFRSTWSPTKSRRRLPAAARSC